MSENTENATSDEDVEGHRLSAPEHSSSPAGNNDEDDVQGHKTFAPANTSDDLANQDDDDVAGHRWA